MTAKTIIGANAAIRYLKAFDAHINFWREVNPAVSLAYVDKPEHVGWIHEYAAALPNTLIVARVGHPLDGAFHLAPTAPGDTRHYIASPIDYHNQYGDLGRVSNVALSILNEPNGYAPPAETMRLVAWLTEYIGLAIASKTKSVLFNWADKHPKIVAGMWTSEYDGVLKLMSAHPELFYMGLHTYGPDEIVSVINGYLERCKFLNITPCKVIFSEWGIDSTGGVERGYKDYANYKNIYAQWQIIQVKNALAAYIKSGILVGMCIFQEGNSGGWESFDIETDAACKAEIKRAALAGETAVPVTQPPVVTPPTEPPKPPKLPAPKTVTLSIDILTSMRSNYMGAADALRREGLRLATLSDDILADVAVIDEIICQKIGKSEEG